MTPSSFARAHRYTVVDRPRVDLLADPTIERTDIRVDARFAEADPRPRRPRAGRSSRRSASRRARSADPTATRVFADPEAAHAPRAVLRVTDPDGRTRDVVVDGRQPDDRPGDRQRPRRRSTGASRATTAGSSAAAGRSSTTDLGSTNGSRVNGVTVARGRPGRRRSARGGGYRAHRRGRRGARLMDGFLLVALDRPDRSSSASSTCSCSGSSARSCATCGRPPATRSSVPGRLVVLESPSGEPPAGQSFGLDAVTTLGRDVNNAIVVDDPFASTEHAVLTFRGRAWYVEDLGSTNGTYVNGRRVDGVAPIGFGDELQVGQVRFRLERGLAMTAETASATRRQALPSVLGPIRPRPRWTRAPACSGLVAVALVVGSVSLGGDASAGRRSLAVRPTQASSRSTWLALLAAHLAQVLAGRRTDQVLLPTIAPARRDPPAADGAAAPGPRPTDVLRHHARAGPGPARAGCSLALAVITILAIVVRSDSWLRRYKYTWAAAGVGLLLLTFVLGTEVNGAAADHPARAVQRPADRADQGDPGRSSWPATCPRTAPLLVEQDMRVGPLRLPPRAVPRCRWSRCGRSPS